MLTKWKLFQSKFVCTGSVTHLAPVTAWLAILHITMITETPLKQSGVVQRNGSHDENAFKVVRQQFPSQWQEWLEENRCLETLKQRLFVVQNVMGSFVGPSPATSDKDLSRISTLSHQNFLWSLATGFLPSFFRRFKSTPDPDTFEKYRDTSPISIAILLQKYALLSTESSIYTANLYHDTPPICIAILLRKY